MNRSQPANCCPQENILIYIMANLSFLTRLSADVLTEQRIFYGYEAGWGFELTMTLSTILYGFALAGLCRSLVVEPAGLLWPGVLGNTALNAALHTNRKEGESECVTFACLPLNFLLPNPFHTGIQLTPKRPLIGLSGQPLDTSSLCWHLRHLSSGIGSPTSSSRRSATSLGFAGLLPGALSSTRSSE